MTQILDQFLINPLFIGFLLIGLILVNFILLKVNFFLRQTTFGKHYKYPFYVANPVQRQVIEMNHSIPFQIWINWILQVATAMLCSLILIRRDSLLNLIGEIIVGFLIFKYFTQIIELLGQFWLFRYVKKNPNSLHGEVQFSSQFIFQALRNEVVIYSLIWFVIFSITERVFFLGGTLSSLVLYFYTFRWARHESLLPS